MSVLRISEAAYRDKIMGCWVGKNAGGTLGAPIEKMWGYPEPFNLDYYMEIKEGGIPNDDLEIQLIWLMALEDRGLDLTCRDLAEYWLNCILYNPDEYGLHKTNLRQGLCPPLSGWYNNHFKDCMGSPIRSEIWACIAPGMPDVAAHYAWHDAVCDHAGGESVYGEMFNAALESAAFFISDRDQLLDLGLSVIPEDCKTAQTIRFARRMHAQKLSWLEARNRVMEFAYHSNAQHSPINLGFQTLGWLYGHDFGDSLCKAVNCGWDTDCTGATLGAILGIIAGARELPAKWTEPLGENITTNESWGLRHLRIPRTLTDLTERTIALGRQLLARHGVRVILGGDGEDAVQETDFSSFIDYGQIRKIQERRFDTATYSFKALDVLFSYPGQPVIASARPVIVQLTLHNTSPEPIMGAWTIDLPAGFTLMQEASNRFAIAAGASQIIDLEIAVEGPSCIQTSNQGWVKIALEGRPMVEAAPLMLIGARRWLVSELQPDKTLEDDDLILDQIAYNEPKAGWRAVNWIGNELSIEPCFDGQPGVIYLQHYIKNPEARPSRIGVANNYRMKLWLNGQEVKSTEETVPLRPSYWGDEKNYCDLELPAGWNHVLIKLERGQEPVAAHFTVAYDPALWHGMDDLEQTRFPWEDPQFDPNQCNYVTAMNSR